MRQWLGKTEDMNDSGHIWMDQANELEISGDGENHGEGASLYERGSGHAGRAIERRRIGRKSGTPDKERWAVLVRF